MNAPVSMPHVMPTYGRLPIALSHGEGAYVWDTEGRRYLDGLSGIAVNTLGHKHPKLVAALQDQVKRWDDPAYVEQQARERLKFVRPGETAYQVIGAEKLLGDPLAGRARVISPNRGDHSVPWYGRMWSSIVIADRACALIIRRGSGTRASAVTSGPLTMSPR